MQGKKNLIKLRMLEQTGKSEWTGVTEGMIIYSEIWQHFGGIDNERELFYKNNCKYILHLSKVLVCE